MSRSAPLGHVTAMLWLGLTSASGRAAALAPGAGDADLLGRRAVELRANEFTSSTQENVALDIDGDGNVLLVWDSRRQQSGKYGVYARLVDGEGRALSGEFKVDATGGHALWSEREPAAAFDADGGAWIVWTADGADGQAGSILARRFERRFASASPVIGVNQTRRGHQHGGAVEVNRRGEALLVWAGPDAAGRSRVFGRFFGRDAAPLGDEFVIGGAHDGHDALPSLAALPDGAFAVAWGRTDGRGVPVAIVGQRVAPGEPVTGDEVVLSEAGEREPVEPSIDADATGRVFAAWMRAAGEGHSVMLRRFDARLAAQSGPEVVADAREGWLSGAAVAARGDGGCAVLYNHFGRDGSKLGVFGRFYASDGAAQGGAQRLTRQAEGNQYLQMARNARRAACGTDGQLALAWSGDAGAQDEWSANLTLHLPAGFSAERSAGPVVLAAAVRGDADLTPNPPIYDPNWEPLAPFLGPGDGPDFGFEGVTYTGWTPPDPELAAGPDHVVVMTNGAIAFFDKGGTRLFQDEIENNFGFWGAQGATNFVFDPETLYDPHSGRFMAMACERGSNGRSYFLLAVSDDSNPVGTWYKYRIDVNFFDNDIDSPNMAVDANVIYLSADFFGPDKYGIIMIDKAPLLSGGAVSYTQMLLSGAGEQSLGIPITYDANAPAQYMIQSSEGTPNGLTFDEVRFHAITDPLGTPQRVAVDVNVPTYSYPNQPPQRGTSSRPFLFEPRFWSCQYINGSLWAVHHVNSTRARARWYEFRMNNWPNGPVPTLRQWGELDYGGGIHTFFPSIAADAQGNAVITFSRSATDEYISMARAFRRHDDALNTFRPMEFVKLSSAAHTSGRWGDYSGNEPDPAAPDSFWIHHEWTNQVGSWRTWIARVDTLPCDPCDANCDGTADANDIEAFIGLLFAGDAPCGKGCAGDTNGDGDVNAADIEGFIGCLFTP